MSLKRKGKGKGKGRRPSVDVDDDARQRPANPVARAPEATVHRLKFAVERYFEDAPVAICAKALARVVKVGTVVLPCSRNMWVHAAVQYLKRKRFALNPRAANDLKALEKAMVKPRPQPTQTPAVPRPATPPLGPIPRINRAPPVTPSAPVVSLLSEDDDDDDSDGDGDDDGDDDDDDDVDVDVDVDDDDDDDDDDAGAVVLDENPRPKKRGRRRQAREADVADVVHVHDDGNGAGNGGGAGAGGNDAAANGMTLGAAKMHVLSMFPDVDMKHVDKLLVRAVDVQGMPMDAALANVISTLVDTDGKYPRDQSKVKKVEKKETRNYDDCTTTMSSEYQAAVMWYLMMDFPYVPKRWLKRWCAEKNFHFIPTHAYITTEITKPGFKANKSKRHSAEYATCPEFEEELAEFKRRAAEVERERLEEEEKKRLEDEAEEKGIGVECGCCYCDAPIQHMCQCAEGHLFCLSCLKSYAQEQVFGQGKHELKCMSGDCTVNFTRSQIRRALPDKVLRQWEELERKATLEALAEGGMENIVQCPFCMAAVELPEGMNVLKCPNTDCERESCRLCKRESHIPLRCAEVKDKKQTNARTRVEEEMTKARVRVCPKCDTRFFKTEGCNKMTCRCGTITCYICRKNITVEKYKHFCQTPHCQHKRCGKCVLYTDTEYDDRLAVKEAGEKAAQTLADDPEAQEVLKKLQLEKLLEEEKRSNNPAIGMGGAIGQLAQQAHRAEAMARGAHRLFAGGVFGFF